LCEDGDVPESPTPRTRDAEATRRDLLRAARRRFLLLGYERTTTREIAKDVGVNLALINRYFGGKHGLYEAVIASSSDLLAEAPEGDGPLVDEFLGGLDPDAWPDLGGHPLTLLLRDEGADEAIRAMRAQALGIVTARVTRDRGTKPARAGTAKRREEDLRAQLVLALLCGTVALRTTSAVEPLASADPEELRAALQDAIAALSPPA
jgi:AcrR family transcriptional regulator